MIYNLVSGKVVMAKIYDEFAVKSRDWENRAPVWIASALKQLNINLSWEEVADTIEFDNYSFNLPCDVRMLRGILINGTKLDRTTTITHLINNKEIENYAIDPKYYSLNAGKIHVELKSGTAEIVYRKLPLEWDDVLGIWIPMIPDVEAVIEHITWYVFKIILARGYAHPIYSLTTNNELLNPEVRWIRTKKAAKLAAKSMDSEARRIMADRLSSFISDPDADVNSLFSSHRTSNHQRPFGWQEIHKPESLIGHDEDS